MQFQKITSALIATFAVAGVAALPVAASAQGNGKHQGWDHSNHGGNRNNDNRNNRGRDNWTQKQWRQDERRDDARERALRFRNQQLRNQVRREDNRADYWRNRARDDRYRSTTRIYEYPRTTIYRPAPRYDVYRYNGGGYYNGGYYNNYRNDSNEWRTIAGVSGGLALLGLLTHDNTLTFAGTAGTLYSLSRYESDRRSNDRYRRLRAAYFARPYFVRDGRRYDRVIVVNGGNRYYRFVRH